ncbi:hypothetical protein [Legionella parisiensis]|uniref:Uncharacterized protein n=1 Tax=Legionella parisiensis TaxID=45071 RepID=A0A1E5JVK6_9GAMM|nr:hypothetical protein [Legionella parisiensis]KTD41212.1 hypothetical protein Lpar_2529 [Legionella parisiensis]OEH48505.1 hypothetical protein lpari_00454 [Legionella parisiensis]STX76489.1 Uncharacterised protein [Legionella parisiensis]
MGFYNVKNELLNGLFLYVVLSNEQIIYVEDNGKFFHSALANGKKVLAAGKLELEEGVLIKISNESGHYMPTDEEMRYMLSKFLSLSQNANLVYESHCRAIEGVIQQLQVSDFLKYTPSIINEVEVNKYTTSEIDDDHYETVGIRSRYARKPKLKIDIDNRINTDASFSNRLFQPSPQSLNQSNKNKEEKEINCCQKYCTII